MIDDDTTVLSSFQHLLASEGYEVTTASNAKRGLKLIHKMEPDLIVLDMRMPGVSGVGFLKEITTDSGKLLYPVLVLTAYAKMSSFFENIELDGFMLKPCKADDFLSEVERILATRDASIQAKQKTKRKRTVLLGEDDFTERRVLRETLESAGFVVDCAENGSDILGKAIMMTPDVIIVNIVMPQMNGDAVAAMLKEVPKTQRIPVIMYAADESISGLKKETVGHKGLGTFLSSNDANTVLAAVQRILAQGS
jgi:CheY-like chemotaxis protein